MNGAQSSSDKIWLIRSSTRVLGPFSLDEVKEHLASKQISIIDEVRSTQSRWSYIREHKEFLEVVRNIRDEIDSLSEKTMTSSVAHQTITKTDSSQGHIDDQTPTPIPLSKPAKPPEVRPPAMKDVTPMSNSVLRSGTSSTLAKSYGTNGDARVRNQIQKKTNFVRWILVGAVSVALIFVVGKLVLKDRQKEFSYEDLISQALRFRSLGLYEQSLESYRKASAIREPDLETQIQMAPLLISADRQTLVGRRILERALTTEDRSRAELVHAYNGIGLSYLFEGDLKEAESTLQKALGYEPTNFNTLMNMAMLRMKKGNYIEASRDFDILTKKDPQSSLALLGKANALIELSKTVQQSAALVGLVDEIRKMTAKTSYLRHELVLFQIYAQSLLGNVNEVQKTTAQFLTLPMNETENFVRNPQVDSRITQWEFLEKYCLDVFARQSPNAEAKALRAVCLMEVNRDSDAQKFLEEAAAESPKDPYILTTQAAYLNKIGRLQEATAILRKPEIDSLPIRHYIMGEICVATQDITCAQQTFSALFNKDQKGAATYYGLAWVADKSKDRPRAYDYIRAGLQIEPDYAPLIKLRDVLETE